MQRDFGQLGAALALVGLLGGCSWVNPALTTEADSGFGSLFYAPWSRSQAVTLADSYTVRRIRGAEADPAEERLQLEPGNVWPVEEAPRATLANPDAALRGIPAWRPGEGRSIRDLPVDERPGGPFVPPRADATPPAEPRPLELRRRRDSYSAPPPIVQPDPDRVQVLPVPPGGNAPPARRSDGQVVLTPGGPVVTSGGNDRIQSFTTPGGGVGTIHRDGGVTTITPSGGFPQTFPTPR
ncbi:MAG: hypothetical protein AVDCRST_MAG08-3106 [uncultured Acetobacteraceae bacterium]|uniref:Uncharacterized protein n=1 Tax=uncultured Acetobacteraceae bacterium TaxID=169975 RepID=A0A6J4J5E2_9PROT|nr:MAG: hypothetical protein AVDCRST_MAG08-3106 [uncultured Acetobacteraceae bacterium]